MARPAVLKIDILADAKGVGQGVREADSALGKLGKVGAVAGAAVVGGLAVAGAAVGAFGLATVGAASRAEQSAGAIASVYGAAGAEVEAFAATSAAQIGLAASSYRELSAVVGSQLTNMGRSQAEAAGQSDQLIRMGADLAATFGGDVSTAVEAVGSLLRGERDPIEQYGVSISAAAIEARLAAQGLDHLTGAERKAAEATATLAILQEQTASSAGAFARESGTLAGAQAILGAKVEDVKARLGAGLLPAAASAATMLADRVLPAVERVGGQLATNLAPALASAAAWVSGSLVPAATRLVGTFRAEVLPTLSSVAGFVIGRVVPVLGELFGWVAGRLVPALAGGLGSALRGAQGGLASVGAAIERNRPQIDTLLSGLRIFANFVADRVVPIVGTVLGGAFRTLGGVLSTAIDLAGGVGRAFDAVVRAVNRAVDVVRNFRIPDAIAGFFGGPPLATGAPALTGGVGPGPQLAGLATASMGGPAAAAGLLAGAVGGGAVLVDRSDRRVSVTITGALDPVGVARQVEALLADHARRTGRTAALGMVG